MARCGGFGRAALLTTALGSSLLAALTAGGARAQQATLTVSGFGGNLQADLRKTLWAPAAEKAGITLREETHDGIAQARVQVQSGRPTSDVIHLGGDECAVGGKEGLFEKIDDKVVDFAGIPQTARGDTWVATNSYSVVLAYRTDKFKDRQPRTWRDFWAVKDFPGRRALSAYPQEMLEIALMADGVARDGLYPLDSYRALKALARIKPDIAVWWSSGAQSAQLIKDGEVDLMAIWGSRVAGVIKDGAPVAFTYEDGVLGYGCMAILKGSRNAAAAQRFLAGVVSPEIQARIPTMMEYYGPANTKAFEAVKFQPDVLAKSNMSPENRAKQVMIDVNWWRDHNEDVREDFRLMKSR